MGIFSKIFGGGSSSSSSSSQSSSLNLAGSYISPEQLPFLQALWGGGTNLALSQAPQIKGAAQQASGRLAGMGYGYLGNNQSLVQNLGQLGLQSTNQYFNPLQGYASNPFGMAGPQVAQLGQDIGRFFQQSILPGITTGTQQAGQVVGTGRDQVARGIAGQGAVDAFARGATDIYSNAYNTGAQASGQLGQLGLGQYLGQGQAFSQAGQLGLGGLGALGSLFNLQMAPFAAAQQPYSFLGSLLGDPAMQNFAYGTSQSTSTSTSKSSETPGILGSINASFTGPFPWG